LLEVYSNHLRRVFNSHLDTHRVAPIPLPSVFTCICVLPMHNAPRLRSAATQGASEATSATGLPLCVYAGWQGALAQRSR
jgi:hypothetical protein